MNEISYKIILLHLKRRIKTIDDNRKDDHIANAARKEVKAAMRIIEAELKSVEKNGPRVERDFEIMKELYEEML